MTREEKQPAVYIVASRRNGTIYVGVTSELWNRVAAHKNKTFAGFTSKYGIGMLVWYEHYQDMTSAISREKQLKGWSRNKKLKLIEAMNPAWDDLHDRIDSVATLVEK